MPLKLLPCLTVLAGLAVPGAVSCEESHALKGVVGLFTAQGCISCPPADAAFEKIVAKGDVVEAGQKLADVDLSAIEAAGYSTTTIVLITNPKAQTSVATIESETVAANAPTPPVGR